MIYTVTFNPSLDYIANTSEFRLGLTNRTTKEIIYPGGKGINVSLVLRNLGIKSTALGFYAGFTGDEILRLLNKEKIQSDFIKIEEGLSRINVKIRSFKEKTSSLEETELNGMGPVITEDAIRKLYEKLDQLESGDILILAGSIPSSMPKTAYKDICERLGGRVRIVVDATKDLLVNVLPYRPFLVKPNNHELGEIFGVTLKNREAVIPYAKKLKEMGAENVLVSMAGEGAVLIAADGSVYEAKVPEGQVKNSVGAGDSMVAGFLTGYLSDDPRNRKPDNHLKSNELGENPATKKSGGSEELDIYLKAFRLGVTTGSASAFSDGMATKEEVMALLPKVDVVKVEA